MVGFNGDSISVKGDLNSTESNRKCLDGLEPLCGAHTWTPTNIRPGLPKASASLPSVNVAILHKVTVVYDLQPECDRVRRCTRFIALRFASCRPAWARRSFAEIEWKTPALNELCNLNAVAKDWMTRSDEWLQGMSFCAESIVQSTHWAPFLS